jgi:hypothetical protein
MSKAGSSMTKRATHDAQERVRQQEWLAAQTKKAAETPAPKP